MSASSRFLNQQKTAKHKRILLERMQASFERKQGEVEALVKAESQSNSAAAQNLAEETILVGDKLPVRYGGNGARLYRDHLDVPLVPSDPFCKLIDIYLDATINKTAHQVLLWPVAPQVLPLVHVLATMEYWHAGHKAGIRGLLYPAKENVFHPLNHLEIDRADLARHAQALVQLNSVSDKDPVLFCAVNTIEVLPTINDLIPHFGRFKKDADWTEYGDHLLEHTCKKVTRYLEKDAIRKSCESLGSPKTAPDALFAFGYQLDREDLRKSFSSLKKVGSPEVCMVNSTRALRNNVPNWRGLLKHFFCAYLEAYPVDRPGLIIVTDDSQVSFEIQDLVEKEVVRAIKRSPGTVPIKFVFNPIACQDSGELGQGLKPQDTPEPRPPEPRKIRVEIKDTDAAKVIKTLYQIRHELKLNEQDARPLLDAAAYLHKLTALAAGNSDIEAWLDERQADAMLRRKLAWSSPRGALIEFIAKGVAKTSQTKLEKLIKLTDKLVENYFDATPMALAVASQAALAVNSSTHTVLIFTNAMHLLLAERYLRRYAFCDGRHYDEFEPYLQLILTKNIHIHLRSCQAAARYVFVGIDDDALRILMTENKLPNDSLLLLTQRNAVYMRRSLRPIFDRPEFDLFKPRLEHIMYQLDESLKTQDVPLVRIDDFVLPSFDFSAAPSIRDDDPETWRIALEDHDPIYRSGTARVYVYDPMSNFHSKSGFIPLDVRALKPGQQLFIMPIMLREQLEDMLKLVGFSIQTDKLYENTLRMYHEVVLRNLNKLFPEKSLSAQVSLLKDDLIRKNPEEAQAFSNLRYWVNLGAAATSVFEQVRPQAPQSLKVFSAFTAALEMSASETEYYWNFAIHPIRVNRRSDGRHVSEIYSRVLFEPESVMVHVKLSQSDIANLFAQARCNIHTVVTVEPPKIIEESA